MPSTHRWRLWLPQHKGPQLRHLQLVCCLVAMASHDAFCRSMLAVADHLFVHMLMRWNGSMRSRHHLFLHLFGMGLNQYIVSADIKHNVSCLHTWGARTALGIHAADWIFRGLLLESPVRSVIIAFWKPIFLENSLFKSRPHIATPAEPLRVYPLSFFMCSPRT